jgi:asparagine synthase (glutamine-hydrolysing)
MSAEAAIVLVGDDPAALERLVEVGRRRLNRAGWSRRVDYPYLKVFAPTAGRLPIVPGFDGHGVLLGELFDSAGARLGERDLALHATRRLDPAAAETFVANRWGRYVLIRRVRGATAVLRDPSGALEAVVWRKSGVTLVATAAEAIPEAWLPDEAGLDWSVIARLAARPGDFRHELGLTGFTPVAAGELRLSGLEGESSRQIWKPANIYRQARSRPPPDLGGAVRGAVRALAGDRAWIAELSGGLDSAIVALSLTADQRARVRAWVNHYVDQPEGDERPWARSVLARDGLPLTEVHRSGLQLDERRLNASAGGFRPAINDIDPDYNDDIAERVESSGAWGSLTGQGGDAVFFQMVSPLIAFDELHERTWRFRFGAIHRLGRWLRRSVWPGDWVRTWVEHRRDRATWDHPWLDDLRGVPPAKAGQIATLAFCQTFQGPAVRGRSGPCVNPLLSQPVLEAGLAWSAVDLTWGGRDRAAARAAFADVLPPAILERRSKGELGANYGQAVADRLPFLRDYLLGGALAEAGLIDRSLEARMSREALLWRGGYSELLSLALTEGWVRRWRSRLERRRT